MQARRRLAAALTAAVSVLGLAGCEKPTPYVTLYSGDTALKDTAFSFCFEGQDRALEPGTEGACRFDADRAPQVLEVRPGDEVLIDVDKDLVEAGWYAALRVEGRDPVRTAVQDEHTTRVQPDFNQGAQQLLEVRKLSAPREDAEVVGLWVFALVPE